MSEELNIYRKIADVKANIDGFTKDTKGYNFTYVSGSQILHRIRNKMIEHRLLLIPSTSNEKWTTHTYKNKKGHEVIDFIVEMDLNYKWVNADKPEEQLDISYHAFGQQSDISQAHGTALTYSERYFLMKFFNIPTDEDDADAKEKQDKYSKVDPKNVEELEKEIEKFSELMKSLGTDVSTAQVKSQLDITDINQLTNNQIAALITKLNKWSKQAIDKENAQ
ncbi:single-stranded DNA-binding protein [Staphylococcus xylosus]|uniref:Single-stranded DNA-binding protein n=1 Tax=Staphylococcus xylosus TaxID=1288 RepID=A0A418IRD6_STAXY|nr:ERF family protein [Staphylococcus xylosus]PTI58841.1 single-stranded DNA-binding protein [Staphylococcus xylosus]RIN12422.1 single-stranded DNA-binding protein [Staphylococcus xylosus]